MLDPVSPSWVCSQWLHFGYNFILFFLIWLIVFFFFWLSCSKFKKQKKYLLRFVLKKFVRNVFANTLIDYM